MHVMRHDSERYTGRVLISSADRRWRGLMAELRSHSPGEIPPCIAAFTQVSILIRGLSIVTRKSGDIRQRIEGVPGTIGLSPMGLHEDFTHLRCSSGVMPQVAAVIPGASRASRIAEDSDALNEVAPAELVGMI